MYSKFGLKKMNAMDLLYINKINNILAYYVHWLSPKSTPSDPELVTYLSSVMWPCAGVSDTLQQFSLMCKGVSWHLSLMP